MALPFCARSFSFEGSASWASSPTAEQALVLLGLCQVLTERRGQPGVAGGLGARLELGEGVLLGGVHVGEVRDELFGWRGVRHGDLR